MEQVTTTDVYEALKRIEERATLAAKNVLTLDDVCVLTGLKKSYLYQLTSRREIPYYRPNGKLVYFDRKEVEAWQRRNRVNTRDEAESMAAGYVYGKEVQR